MGSLYSEAEQKPSDETAREVAVFIQQFLHLQTEKTCEHLLQCVFKLSTQKHRCTQDGHINRWADISTDRRLHRQICYFIIETIILLSN